MDDDTAAHIAIRNLLAACTQAGDARRADDYAACFAPDGILELGERIAGRDSIRAWMTAPSVIPKPRSVAPGFVSHHLTTCRIDLTAADAAKARTYWLVITAAGVDHSGYYDDVFTVAGRRWLIAHRKPRTLWTAPTSLLAR